MMRTVAIVLALVFLGLTPPARASEVVPPRMVVVWLVEAVQGGKDEIVGWYFKFDREKHGALTPFSREQQIQILKDIPIERMAFDKDKYAVDEGKRFVVRLVAPKRLDFEVRQVDLKGDLGPPRVYEILAVRETADTKEQGTATPKLAQEWRTAGDGKVSACLSVDGTAFGTNEPVRLRCAVSNGTDKTLTVLRPFGDPFHALSAGLAILGPDGPVPYRGPMKEYVLGTASFMELPPHGVIEGAMELPFDVFPSLGKPGLHVIGYTYLSDGHPSRPPPEDFWRGKVTTGSVTVLVR